MERQECVTAIRNLANLIEHNTSIPVPGFIYGYIASVHPVPLDVLKNTGYKFSIKDPETTCPQYEIEIAENVTLRMTAKTEDLVKSPVTNPKFVYAIPEEK